MERKAYPNKIRVVLAYKNLTNRWLAEQMNVSEMTVSRWTTNKIQPSMSQFVEISKLLNLDINELIDFSENANIEKSMDAN